MAAYLTLSFYNAPPHYPGLYFPKPDSLVKRVPAAGGTTAPIPEGANVVRLACEDDARIAIQATTATATTSAEYYPAGRVEYRELRTGDTYVVAFTK